MAQDQAQKIEVKTQVGIITIELVNIAKKYNIREDEILAVVKRYLFSDDGLITLYSHSTWGSCREWKHIVLDNDNYINIGEWINNNSYKNVHKYKKADLKEFLERYKGKELVVYVHESPSCNASKEFSFRVVVKIT
jgi:hypothetical protein